jgi:hypothetical protein
MADRGRMRGAGGLERDGAECRRTEEDRLELPEYTSWPARVMRDPHENARRVPGRAWSSTARAVPDAYWRTPRGSRTTSTASHPGTARLMASSLRMTVMRPFTRGASPRFAPGTRQLPRSPDQARAAPCTGRASRTPRRCKPSSCASVSAVEVRVSGCGAGADGVPAVPCRAPVGAHRRQHHRFATSEGAPY